jgi:DNA-binding MarR family transcriptional regulator/N-acetylglutamate synthase-like GNAT family acetyltransferase
MSNQKDIEAIRQFNRFYTQKIGVLRENLLDSEFSLTEGRVVYELAHRDAATASDLARDLDLDAGYLSRILKRLERKRYLARTVAGADSRRRDLALTAAGRRAFARIDARSRRDLAAIVKPLSDLQRRSVVEAMRTISSALDTRSAADAPLLLRPHRSGDIGWVVQRHGELYSREYGLNEEFEALVAQIAAEFIQHLDPEREHCWIAERDGRRLGCVFLVAKTKTVAKLRLLLVEPEARGSGLGRRLVGECIRFAREAGYRKLALWTQSNLDAARAIYASSGFACVSTQAHHSFGHDLLAETWELTL